MKRLYEVDVVRILTFACVIGVHVSSHTIAADDIPLHGLLGLLHFTRLVFFALTTFVLLLGQLHRPKSMRQFWPKRFLLVGVPYVAWSVIYFVASNIYSQSDKSPIQFTVTLLYRVVTGSAWYHLYFLLVTMQVYLLVPLIVWFVRKTRGHHRLVLAIFLLVQLAITTVYMYHPGTLGWYGPAEKQFFWSYPFFIIAGAIGADHATTFLAWVRAHRGTIGLVVLGGAVLSLGVFALQHWAFGLSMYRAGTPLQPVVMIWAICVALGFLAVGTWWADRRVDGSRFARAVDRVSDRSFGIFLVHPMVLWILLWIGAGWIPAHVTTPWLTLVAYVTVIGLSYLIADLARRSPLSLPLAGRRWRS